MVELITAITLMVIAIAAVVGAIAYLYTRQLSDSNSDLIEQSNKLIELSKEFAALSKQAIAQSDNMTKFIDKNIHERVIYADPQIGYSNAHKYEPDTEEEDEDDDGAMEMTPETLDESEHPTIKDKKTEG